MTDLLVEFSSILLGISIAIGSEPVVFVFVTDESCFNCFAVNQCQRLLKVRARWCCIGGQCGKHKEKQYHNVFHVLDRLSFVHSFLSI